MSSIKNISLTAVITQESWRGTEDNDHRSIVELFEGEKRVARIALTPAGVIANSDVDSKYFNDLVTKTYVGYN